MSTITLQYLTEHGNPLKEPVAVASPTEPLARILLAAAPDQGERVCVEVRGPNGEACGYLNAAHQVLAERTWFAPVASARAAIAAGETRRAEELAQAAARKKHDPSRGETIVDVVSSLSGLVVATFDAPTGVSPRKALRDAVSLARANALACRPCHITMRDNGSGFPHVYWGPNGITSRKYIWTAEQANPIPAEDGRGQRVGVYMTKATLARLRELGNGNVSAGIRAALEEIAAQQPKPAPAVDISDLL